MLVNLDGFSWVYVLMHRYSKSAFLQVTLNFELEKMILVDILTHSFDFHFLTKFAKIINMTGMISLWCDLLCKRSIYTLKSDRYG